MGLIYRLWSLEDGREGDSGELSVRISCRYRGEHFVSEVCVLVVLLQQVSFINRRAGSSAAPAGNS